MDASALSSAEYWLSIIGTVKLIAALLVAVGVAFEFGGDWIAGPFEKTVEEARKLELSRLSAEAEIAKSEIAKANASAAVANESAAAANARAAQLQQAAAWRILSEDSKAKLVSRLQNASGAVEISYPANGIGISFSISNM